jgi:hypothetical protein
MMMIEYGLGAVLVVMYMLAWMALVLLGLELAPRRRFNNMPFAQCKVDLSAAVEARGGNRQ